MLTADVITTTISDITPIWTYRAAEQLKMFSAQMPKSGFHPTFEH
jgi:hypothetical protein